MKIKILIADDHAIVRYGLSSLFRTQKDMEVVGCAKDGAEVVRLALENRPDVVVMDLSMPQMDGAVATAELQRKLPSAKVLLLTSYLTSDGIAHALKAGALGAITKTTEDKVLIPTVRKIASGERVISPEISQYLDENPPVPRLSEQQSAILQSITRGLSNADIAKLLDIRQDSVEKYIRKLFAKLGAANRAEAVAIALRKQLLKI